jgi:tetratricopeptide (TPR) repeat protein
MSLREIAEELGVAYVLEGTVRTDRGPDGAGQVRVTPQLIRAQDDSHLWTERYTASLAPGEIFSVQATIAEQVATALDVTLLGSERAALEAAPTDDPAAYDAYLLGRFYWKRRTPADLQRAAEYFRRAVALDPDFAEAHVGLADAYSLYAYYEVPDLSRADAYTAAEVSARRAIGLDRNLAGAWASLGNILTYGAWEWEAADSAFRRAIALDTEYAVARYWYADLLLIVGRIDEAIAQGERAVALDPASPVAQHVLGTALAYDGRYEEAIAREQASIDLVPEFAFGRSGLAWVLALHGRSDEAEREFLRLNWPAGLAANIAQFLADPTLGAGFIAEVSQFERDARDRGLAMAPPSFFGALYGVVGANDSAFARFEQAYTQRSEFLPFNMRHPMLDPIRSDPRYDELMRRMGLAP